MFIAAQFTIAEYWKQPKCPSANEWIQKFMIFLYSNNEVSYREIKKKIPFTIAKTATTTK